MANGFPKPQGGPAFPPPSSSPLGLPMPPSSQSVRVSRDASDSPAASTKRASSVTRASASPRRKSPLRWTSLLVALFLLAGSAAVAGVASHTFNVRPAEAEARVHSEEPASNAAASTVQPFAARRLSAPNRPAIAAAEAPPPAEYHGEPARVPEAYTGDPEGQALWEKTVDEDQQTLQPEDLLPAPELPRVDLSKLPAYQARHMDADGNLNE